MSYIFLSVTISLKRCINFPTLRTIIFNLIKIKAFTYGPILSVLAFRCYLLLLFCCYVKEKFIQEKYEGCKLIMNSNESKQYSITLEFLLIS